RDAGQRQPDARGGSSHPRHRLRVRAPSHRRRARAGNHPSNLGPRDGAGITPDFRRLTCANRKDCEYSLSNVRLFRMTYDVIIRNGLWFDGTGKAPQTRTLGIRDGVVATVSAEPLDETGCPDVIDGAGKWVAPGFIDVHTHYDAEILLDPGLRESVRHGVTTVLLGNCSLSTIYADSDDAADLFSRVEAVPRKYVIGALDA